ncbi:MAG: ABC transporter ATP-binding protein [Phycisphaerales bacterium]|jgi:iron(III) transport system ATP-binding protein|nr:ABC transporter ATP-binding protein [Phycisphaerales bacterium]
MSTRIDLRDVAKSFPAPRGLGGARVTHAVRGVTLTIEPGELFFLLGPSGCGKTTLLRMIAGFIDPTGGTIAFNGRDVTHTPPSKRNTGMVFQSYALWPHMTVAQNVAFGLGVRKVAKPERERRVAEALGAVRLSGYEARKPNQLSGGQQQRVALARALVIRPEVLLLDEPLSNLDAKLRLDLRTEIRRVCKASGLTSVYVTHDQKEALSIADRIAIMDRGQVVQLGTPRELYERPQSVFVAEFLGETNFLPGEVRGREGEAIVVRTPAGDVRALASRVPESLQRDGSKVTLSIRPEHLRVARTSSGASDGSGVGSEIQAKYVSMTYLGDQAQHTLSLASDLTLRATEVAPTLGAESLQPGAIATLACDAAHVVALPPGERSA